MSRVTAALTAAALGLAWLPMSAPAAQAASADLVISQVYGGGGNVGAPYTHDYVELFNRGATTVTLTGKSVQYTSASGPGLFSANSVALPSGSLAPGRHYLIRMGGGATGVALPTPDATGTVAMSATAGKVVLVDSATGLACNGSSTPCNATQLALIRDLVGYGTTTTFSEGSPTANLSNTTAALRQSNGCVDSDSNSADFATGAPTPRHTASAATPCTGTDSAPAVTSTVPPNGGSMAMSADLTVTFNEPVNVTGTWFTLSCSTSGSISPVVTGGPSIYTLNPPSALTAGESCTLTILATQVSDQDATDPPDTMAANYVATVWVQDPCVQSYTSIPVIQGSGATAAITGDVTTAGVVSADFEGTSAVGGFYLQEPAGDANPATSDAIFVYTGNANLVTVGQLVRVTGYARERYGQTTLNSANTDAAAVPASGVYLCGSGNSVAATDVTLPYGTAAERFEGMLVRYPQSLVISGTADYDRFGEVTLGAPVGGQPRLFTGTEVRAPGPDALAVTASNAARTVILDDMVSAQNPPVLRHPDGTAFSLSHLFRAGDTVSGVTGILGYDYSAYRIYPTTAATFTPANPRPAVPTGGELRVASANASNYFLTGDGGSWVCGPAKDMACRGWDADQPTERTRQRAKLLAAWTSLDADIIAVMEIENTTGVEPLADLIADMPGWSYIDTGIIGTDAVRSGLLYRSASVTPVGLFKVLDGTVDPRFVDTANRPTLAQTFRDATTGGVFTVVVNHLRSKGSPCTGDPDLGDGQGNCPGTRTRAAQALMDWLATDPTSSGSPDVLVIGDLNAYSQEDPVAAVKAGADDTAGTTDDYTDLLALASPDARHSYTFDSQSGALDHALASAGLAAHVSTAAVWHVNSDEPDVLDYDTTFKPAAQEALYAEDAYRFGDHDPLVVGLDLSPGEPPAQPPEQPPVVTPPVESPPVSPSSEPRPVTPVKQAQTLADAPSRIKPRGLTTLAPRGLRTSAGQPVTSKVTGKKYKGAVRLFTVIRSKGALKVRTYGAKGIRLKLVQAAAGTDVFEPFARTSVYVNGRRRP